MPFVQRPCRGAAIITLLSLSSALFILAPIQQLGAQQRRVDERNLGERILLIVPIVGDGSLRNPRRPLFAPDKVGADGIVSFTAVLSDDGRFALVEYVARNRKAFDEILNDKRVDVQKFDFVKGSSKKEDVEREFRKLKKDFDFAKFKEGK